MTAGGGQHIDSWAGFTVHQPAGWQVRVRNSVVSVFQDPEALVQAMLCPISFAQPQTRRSRPGRPVRNRCSSGLSRAQPAEASPASTRL